ncbi:hypothetical protein GYA27_04470 [candidate division WWE3 bacterium]|uniref:EF-hand domain-containing protein n=1 Tax=candidate division WWE3 bacterium TaxID=2053526 RepID=A0A7X9HI99_UNCKA|nr:hypothetical protein [candidate division WWE3 bacterium]
MKNKTNKLIFNVLFLFMLLFVVLLKQSVSDSKSFLSTNKISFLGKVFAEDDDEEEDEEDEDEEDKDDDDEYEEEIIYETVEIPVVPFVPIQRYVTVVDQGYDIDTDKDGLVDALDPHPAVHEKELFTDEDNDGIPNALDKYKNEDDFLFIDFSDENDNGILDAFEY